MRPAEPQRIEPTRQIVVRPNNSLSRRGALVFFGLVALACLGIALVCVSMGYWPVLPFAGLELAVLATALHLSLQRGRYREIIRVSADRLVVEKGVGRPGDRTEFTRHWASVNLHRSRSAWYPSRLVIQSRGLACEVGHCLTESEREGLGRRLAGLVGPVGQSPALTATGSPRQLEHGQRNNN